MKAAKALNAALAKRVHVVVATTYKESEVMVFAGSMTERQIVAAIARDFEHLSERCPKTLAALSNIVGGLEYKLTTQEVIEQ